MNVKKIICVLLAVFLIIPCLSSCNKNWEDKSTAGINLRIGIWPDSSDGSAVSVWKEYERIMSEKYPDIKLEAATMSYSFEGIVSMAASGSLPTLFSVYFTEPQRLIANSFIADITEYAERYGYLEGQNKQYLSLASKNGRQYGIAHDAYGMALIINMKLFREAGLVDESGMPRVPKNLDEMLETAQIIKAKTGKAGFCISTKGKHGGWQFTNIALAFGARFGYSDDDGNIFSGLADEPSVRAMKYIQKMRWQYDVMPSDNLIGLDYINLFANNEAAMMLAAPDSIRKIITSGSITKDDIAVAPVPMGSVSASLMGGSMYVFSSSATEQEIDACFKLLQIIGLTPDSTEEMRNSTEKELKSQRDAGLAVFKPSVSVWNDAERKQTEEELYNKYINVDMRLYKDYYDKVNGMLVPECQRNCQELYATIDACLYEVITNPNCDVEALMKNTAQTFESFYYG